MGNSGIISGKAVDIQPLPMRLPGQWKQYPYTPRALALSHPVAASTPSVGQASPTLSQGTDPALSEEAAMASLSQLTRNTMRSSLRTRPYHYSSLSPDLKREASLSKPLKVRYKG